LTQPRERWADASAAGHVGPVVSRPTVGDATAATTAASRHSEAHGIPGWLALAVLLAIAGVGGLIDQLGGAQIKGGFAIGLVVASFVGIVIVRRSDMFTIVIAPPLVYFVASAGLLYFRSGSLSNRKVLIDYASQWLVYGFPAIAGATAVVLLIAGIRLIVRR